jgi:Raf kinase inhibitor-like YbhB/YbcL family protein
MKTHRYSLAVNVFSLSLLVGAAACAPASESTDPGNSGGSGSSNTGGNKATGGSNSTGSGGSSNTGGSSSGSGGSSSSGGATGGSSSGGSAGSGGSTGSGGGGSDTGGSTGTGGSTSDASATETGGGGSDGPPATGGEFTLKVLGMDETMKNAGGPVFTPAMSNTSNQSPEMTWSGAPTGTKSFAISMIDTQTPPSKTPPLKAGTSKKVHFVIYNIPASATGLPAKLPRTAAALPMPAGAIASKTFSGFGWFGPGGATSVYLIQLWALDVDKLPGLADGAAQQAAYNALAAHAIGKPVDFLGAGTNGGFK